MIEQNKQDEIRARAEMAQTAAYQRKPFGREWESAYWIKWATIKRALADLDVPTDGEILDVGVGSGWTTVFLAQEGYRPTGIDIGPASVTVGSDRAARHGVCAEFLAADMEDMDLGRAFDACLVFDALHHSQRQRQVVQRIAAHLKPGGWALFGEPSWLHGLSPAALRTTRERGWIERGIRVSSLKRDCRAAGLSGFRRFFEGTGPTEGAGVVWQLARLGLAPISCSPQTSIWLGARKAAADRGDQIAVARGGGGASSAEP